MSYASDYDDAEQCAQGEDSGSMQLVEIDFYEYCHKFEGADSSEMSCSELANAKWRFKQGWHNK